MCGREVGTLTIAARSERRGFDGQERRLLDVLADQVALVAEVLLMAHEVAQSRSRVIAGREAERQRLRRDLHDGLGPALAGLLLQVRAARRSGAEDCAALLTAMEDDLGRCTREIRAIVDRLQPPDLDGGLVHAVTMQARRMSVDGFEVEVHQPDALRPVVAAVELVAYRVVCEALTNAVRHGRAGRCRVSLADRDGLVVEVRDDGVGIGAAPPAASEGVGLASMRDRVAEVGGRLRVERLQPHGTVVEATLPWSVP